MIIQTIDHLNYYQEARLIKIQASEVLEKWGLPARFKRWRLSKDPRTRMVVLFGELNTGYIGRQTVIQLKDYFDPCLLLDLANQLQVQVITGTSDGMRYAFIMNRGLIDKLPSNLGFTFLDKDKLYRVAHSEMPVLEVIEHRTLSIYHLVRLRRLHG